MPTTVTKRISATAAGGATRRVTATAAGGITPRLPINYLLMESDESSAFILLEGDMQTGDDLIKLEGDEALAIGGTTTRRIAEAVE